MVAEGSRSHLATHAHRSMPRKATSPARTPKVSSTRGVFWDEKEEKKLTTLKSKGTLTWAEIAEKLGTGRSAESVRQHWKLMQGAGTPKSSPKTPKAPPPTPKTPAAAAVAAGPSKALGVFMAVVLIAATAVATYAIFAPVD